jgi:hypothetical protein
MDALLQLCHDGMINFLFSVCFYCVLWGKMMKKARKLLSHTIFFETFDLVVTFFGEKVKNHDVIHAQAQKHKAIMSTEIDDPLDRP